MSAFDNFNPSNWDAETQEMAARLGKAAIIFIAALILRKPMRSLPKG